MLENRLNILADLGEGFPLIEWLGKEWKGPLLELPIRKSDRRQKLIHECAARLSGKQVESLPIQWQSAIRTRQATIWALDLESVCQTEYSNRNIPEVTSNADRSLRVECLLTVLSFLSENLLKSWEGKTLEEKKTIIRNLASLEAKNGMLRLSGIKFGSFSDAQTQAEAVTILKDSVPVTEIHISTALLSRSILTLVEILNHELAHVFQSKQLYLGRSTSLKTEKEAAALIARDKIESRLNGKQRASTYSSSLSERHANAFAASVVNCFREIQVARAANPGPGWDFEI